MIILDATTRSFEAKLGGAAATTELPFVCAFVDVTTTTYTPAANTGITTGGTAVTLAAAPAASTQRQVKFLSIRNSDTVPATVTVQYNDNATKRIILSAILAVGYSLVYTDGKGFQVTDNNGNISTATQLSAHESTHISGGSDPFLSTDLLEAIVKRLKESGGPTTLTMGSVPDGNYFQRSGSNIIGSAGTTEPALRIVKNTLFK